MFGISKIRNSIGLKSLFYFGIPSLIIFTLFTQVAHSHVRHAAERDYQRNASSIVNVIKTLVDPEVFTQPDEFLIITEKIVRENPEIEKIDIHIRKGTDDIVSVSTDNDEDQLSSRDFVKLLQENENSIERRGDVIEVHSPLFRDGKPEAVIGIQLSTVEEQLRITRLIGQLLAIGAIGALFMVFVMFVTFRRTVIKPIAGMVSSTKKVVAGDYDVVKVERSDEIGSLAKHFNRMLEILKRREDENRMLYNKLELSYKEARSEAITDDLTTLYNYRHFRTRLSEEINRSSRKKSPIALAFIDIDNFKDFNDKFGHQAGDVALKIVSDVIKRQIRSSDFAARYGGEELVVILPETSYTMANVICERIRAEVKSMTLLEAARQLSVSIGIAIYPEDAISADQLIQQSDKSMYEAKKLGKDQIVSIDSKGESRLSSV